MFRTIAISFLLVLFLSVNNSINIYANEKNGQSLSPSEQRVLYSAQEAMKTKDYSGAVTILSKYIDKAKGKTKHHLIYFTLGNLYSMKDDPESALKNYTIASVISPNDTSILKNMGRSLIELQRYEEAGDILVKAWKLSEPDSAELAYHASAAYMLAGSYTKALKFVKPVIDKLASPDKRLYKLLLKIYMETGENQKALEQAWKIVSIIQDEPGMWKILTKLYIDKDDYVNAAAAFSTYLSLSDKKSEDLKLSGDLYRMADAPLRAAKAYELLITEGAAPSVYEITASSYITAHKPAKAIKILEKGLKKHSSMELRWMLAGIYYTTRDFKSAAAAFEKCAKDDFKQGKAHLMAGYCALYLNRLNQAKASFKLASQFPQQKIEALKRLKELNQ